MQFEPDYTIELPDGGKVPLLFNNWGFVRLSEKKGVEYEELANGCFPIEKGKKEDGTPKYEPGKTLLAKNYPDILLIGAQAYCKYNNLAFTHNPETDPYSWVDELGWYNSEAMEKIVTLFMAKLLRLDISKLDAKKAGKEEEKKKELEPELNPNP